MVLRRAAATAAVSLALLSVFLLSSPAFAVNVTTITTGGQASASRTFVLVNVQTQAKHQGEEDDDDRVAGVPLRSGDKAHTFTGVPAGTYRLQVIENGRIVSTSRPFRVADGAANTFTVDTATGTVAQGLPGSGGVTVSGADRMYRGMEGLKVSGSFAYTFGRHQTHLSRQGNDQDTKDVVVNDFAFRPDIRYYLPDVGNMAPSVAHLGLSECYLGAQGAIPVERDDDTGVKGNVTNDTVVWNRELIFALTLFAGCTVLDLPNQNAKLKLHAGPRFTWIDHDLDIDETAGGGGFTRIEKTQTAVGGTVGLEYSQELDLGLPNSMRGGFQLGGWMEYMPGYDIRTRTAPFNFDYDASIAATMLWTLRLGFWLKI